MTRSHVAFGPSYILIALVRGPSQTHVLAWTVARTCVEGRYVLPDFASNACPLCLKRMPSLPQTLSSAPANVIIRPCKRYHPPLQTFASDSGFFFRVTMRGVVFLSLRGFVLDTADCRGQRKDICNISFAGGRDAPSRVSFVVSKICINGKVAVTLYHIIYIRKNIYGYTATVSQCDGRVQKPVCQETA